MARIGELIDGKYEILSLIGEGGMSRVWLARDHRLNKLWAVKEIGRTARDANNAVVVQSLITEANLMKRLDHPSLPRIVDIIEDGKTIYVVMDYVEGESLKKVMRDAGHPMDEADVISWGIQLCDVLEYLHTRTPPVIYRDMKPGNIMLREDGTVKLIDFGIAREYKEGRTSDTQILGTRGYAAPEQFSLNMQTDARTDIYSLGVTLYTLVTGRSPSDDPVLRPIREINPRLSEGLEYIILKATRQDPAERYQSCAEMRYDLEHHDRLTEGYRAAQRSKLRRFNVLRGAAIALAAVGVACVAGSFWLRNSTYQSYLESARAASVVSEGDAPSAAETLYDQAASVDPSVVTTYSELVNNVYKADQNFTIAESSRLAALMDEHRASIEGSSDYAKLCYDIGTLYFVYYEQTGEDEARNYAMSAGVQAAQWFQRAIDSYDQLEAQGRSCSLTLSERQSAAAYVTIGQFYQKLSQATLEGSEGSVYEGYWDSLSLTFESLGDEEPVMVRLRLYQLIYEAIASPTYLNGFRRAGVEEQQARDLLERVLRATASLSSDVSANEKSQEMYDEIVGDVIQGDGTLGDVSASAASRNIDTVYGSVGASAESGQIGTEGVGTGASGGGSATSADAAGETDRATPTAEGDEA
ncbi:serine/threonine protein kinase [Thermophilibacter sp.]